MEDEQVNRDLDEKKQALEYEAFMSSSVVEEQPFYYKGMSFEDYQHELAYLNHNMTSFYDGSYMPLWKQPWFR